MSEWSWVVLGYAVAYVAIAAYVGIVVRSWLRTRRGTEGQR